MQDDPRLIESSLFARIPFDRSTFTEVHEVVQYVDGGNDMFQSFPLRKNMEQLEMRVCDAKGRSLAQLDPTQADHGLMTSLPVCLLINTIEKFSRQVLSTAPRLSGWCARCSLPLLPRCYGQIWWASAPSSSSFA